MFERAGHKDYADNVREILEAEDISSVEADATTPKPLPEQKPEFPSVESVSLSPSAATTTTVVVEKEHKQGTIIILSRFTM